MFHKISSLKGGLNRTSCFKCCPRIPGHVLSRRSALAFGLEGTRLGLTARGGAAGRHSLCALTVNQTWQTPSLSLTWCCTRLPRTSASLPLSRAPIGLALPNDPYKRGCRGSLSARDSSLTSLPNIACKGRSLGLQRLGRDALRPGLLSSCRSQPEPSMTRCWLSKRA